MKNYILFLAIALLSSCNNTNQQPVDNNAAVVKTLSDSLYKSVMEGHDRGMAKMGEITRLRNLIRQQQDSIQNLKIKNPGRVSMLDSLARDLIYADELMYKWMTEFDPNKAGNTEEEKAAFYKKEKEKVDTVEARINNSIQKARQTFIP